MTHPDVASEAAYQKEDQDSVLASANVLLRWRRTIISLGLFGVVLGLTWGLLTPYRYMSTARFIPQAAGEGSNSALAAAASQFGIRMPSSGASVWGPPVYVELLRSRALLEPILFDTVVVAEESNRRTAIIDLLKIEATNPRRRLDLAVEGLRGMVKANEETKLNAVELEVTTKWPSVSHALANRLLQRINEFNFEIRKSQARSERQFVEQQSRQAEQNLRDAESRLQLFLQRNRACCSPELQFERDRLQREVTSRQMLYSSWLERSEEARIREVRDTPVITVIETPQIPSEREARGTVKKMFFIGLFFASLGVLAAFFSRWVASARAAHTEQSREFFQLVNQATPRFLRKVRK